MDLDTKDYADRIIPFSIDSPSRKDSTGKMNQPEQTKKKPTQIQCPAIPIIGKRKNTACLSSALEQGSLACEYALLLQI